MLQYIKENKQWMFSGIGVFVLTLLFAAYTHYTKIENKSTEISKPIPNISNLTPLQIVDAIKKNPPLQREEVAKGYSGIKVAWELTFLSASRDNHKSDKTKDDIISVMLRYPDNKELSGAVVFCDNVDLSKNPEFKIMESGKILKVNGVISYANDSYIRIKDVNFSY